MKIHPVIICGGSGTRLWPLSRQNLPKQFAPIISKNTLFEQCLKKCQDPLFEKPICVTANNYEGILKKQISNVGTIPGGIILEPKQMNTAAAVLAGATYSVSDEQDPLIVILPSDHYIPDKDDFIKTIKHAATVASDKYLVLIGVKPENYNTEFGYIKTDGDGTVEEFTEKPNIYTVKQYVDSGDYHWNAGIIVGKRSVIISECKTHYPSLIQKINTALTNSEKHNEAIKLPLKYWDEVPNISFDLAILERSKNLKMVTLNSHWSDLGSWYSLKNEVGRNKNTSENNAMVGNAIQVNSKNCFLFSDNKHQIIAACDVENIVAVATSDAVLIADLKSIQSIKKLSENLETNMVDFEEKKSDMTNIDSEENFVFENDVLQLSQHKIAQQNQMLMNNQNEGLTIVVESGELELISDKETVFLSKGDRISIEKSRKIRLKNISKQTAKFFAIQYRNL